MRSQKTNVAAKRHIILLSLEKKQSKYADIWKGIRSLVNLKSTKSTSIKLLDKDNNLLSVLKIISNMFNDHFSTIGSQVEQKICFQPDLNGNVFINPTGPSFFLFPTVPGEVEKIIDALNMKKSTGPNCIPISILKIFKLFFSVWLSKLVHLCFEVGVFPDILKFAKIIPLHKKESKLDILTVTSRSTSRSVIKFRSVICI